MHALFSAHKMRFCRRIAALFLLLLVSTLSALPVSSTDAVSRFERSRAEQNTAGRKTSESPVTASTAVSSATLSLSAESAILLNGENGEIYYEKNADVRMPMASTTKIMTALVAIESLPLDTVIKVHPSAVGVEGSSVYLYAGEELTLEALLYALLLESANDAAEAIAYGVAGGIAEFAARMNEKATSLGLCDTHFENPHGLDSEEHYTTAHDLARITAAAFGSEAFRTIVSTYKKTIPQANTDGVRLLINHNRLLRSYDGCVGVKTGYTKRSGRCLVSAAERDGLLLIAVTLSAPDDWTDHTAMLDYGFSAYESIPLLESGRFEYELPIFNGTATTVTASYATSDGQPLSVTLPKGHGEITLTVELPRQIWGTYDAGTSVGRLLFFCGSELLCELPLSLDAPVSEISYQFDLFGRIRDLFA